MRILLVNKFAHLEGGSARYILDLYDLLKAKGHEVAFFSMKPTPEDAPFVRKDLLDQWGRYWISPVKTKQTIYGLEGLRTVFRSLWSFEAKKRFEEFIDDFRPDVIHLNSIQRQLSPSIIVAAKRKHIPLVMTVHGYELVYPHYVLMVHQFDRCKRKSYLQTMFRREMRNSFLLSALTWLEFTLHRLLGVYTSVGAFISPSRFLMSLMHNAGFDQTAHIPNFFPLNKKEPKTNLGSDLIFVARLSEEKGVLELIEAYRCCLQRNASVPRLVLYSRTGPLMGMIDRMVQSSELRGRVVRKTFDPKSFDEIFSSARIVMVPSYPYLENFPYGVTEAFSYGRPVLSSGLGGLSEMVVDGVSGWNVLTQTENVSREVYIKRLAATLERALQAPEDELVRMGKRGYEYVSKLTPDWYYGELMKIYQSTIQRSKLKNQNSGIASR